MLFYPLPSDRRWNVNGKVLFYLQKRKRAGIYHLLRASVYLSSSLGTSQTVQGMRKVRSVLIMLYAEDNPNVMLPDGLCWKHRFCEDKCPLYSFHVAFPLSTSSSFWLQKWHRSLSITNLKIWSKALWTCRLCSVNWY